MDVISHFAARFERTREEELTIEEYLEVCKKDSQAYATAAERMLKAIGEPQTVFRKGTPAMLAVKWQALEDPNASSEVERFGRLVAQTADALT